MVNEQEVLSMYDKEKSTYEIAEHFNTYANKIRRILKKHGRQLRTKGEAQSMAMKSNRKPHPTAGKKRTEAEKLKISNGLAEHWEGVSDESRKQRSEEARNRWNSLPQEKRDEIRSLALDSIRKAAENGSKLENFLLRKLSDLGYKVDFHVKNLIPNENLEIDLFIPSLKTIIEIDGPSHFYPIWGEEKFQKQIQADMQKSGLILSKGYVIIRLKVLKSATLKMKEDAIQAIISNLKQIEAEFPPRSKRFIEVDL